MEITIMWGRNGFMQKRELINYCNADRKRQTYITMGSPIYEAIAAGLTEDDVYVLRTDCGNFSFHVFTNTP